ncbi:MAG: aspartyl protease family protein [Proteobacteria bacterium]|nr:aspartyl protease family protein [Pseudomonadota bacterium]
MSASVNDGHGYRFVLDTGSSNTTLDERSVRRLGLTPEPVIDHGQGLGGPVEIRFYRLDRFRMGALLKRGLSVAGVPAPPLTKVDVVGLAGVDLFEGRLIVWGRRPGCLELGSSGRRPRGKGWTPIQSNWLQPWKILLPVKVGSTMGWGLLDTGAQTTVFSPAFAKAAGLRPAPAAGEKSLSGLDGSDLQLRPYAVSGVEVGAWRIGSGAVAVAPLPVFDRLGGSDQPLAVIGMDWLQGRSFAIDYGSRTVWQRP